MFKSIAQDYFGAFEKKDINKLRELLDSEVVLRDWNVEAKGLENVLNINIESISSFHLLNQWQLKKKSLQNHLRFPSL